MISRTTGDVLWSKNPGLRLPPASCTKIMTALLVLEHYSDLSRYLRAPASVTEQQSVAIGLRPGDRITVRQALRAMLVKSANDATVTLAVGVAGSERAFVRQMNRRAAKLGLTHTHYVNSRGKDATGHYTSARDLATLGPSRLDGVLLLPRHRRHQDRGDQVAAVAPRDGDVPQPDPRLPVGRRHQDRRHDQGRQGPRRLAAPRAACPSSS